jgi:hypothetical protein
MLLLVAIGTVNYASEYLYELISIFNALWPLLAGGKIDLLTAGSVAKKKTRETANSCSWQSERNRLSVR